MDKWKGQEGQEESRIEKKVRKLKEFKEAVISIRDYLSRLDVCSATEQEIFQQTNFERFKSLDLYEVLKTLGEDGEIGINYELFEKPDPLKYYLTKPKFRPGIYKVKTQTPDGLIILEDYETKKKVTFYNGQTLKVSGFAVCGYFEAWGEFHSCGNYLRGCPGRVILKEGEFCFRTEGPDGEKVLALEYDPEHTLFRLGIKKRRSINCSGMQE
jgi:hypothetical protein